ncbi:MAG: GNAT family N-acetyltransferase [Clostridia bacterium]|nr:GNAT family N-acetyltransferase [Clostridia bacterium]
MTEYRKALAYEEADILDFINYVFSQAHQPHDFRRLIPKVYAHAGFFRYHYVAVQEGRIRGTVAVLPVEMPLASGDTLKIGYVGSVSAHPYDRGAGHMKQLMQLMLKEAQGKFDLLVLGGQRQRYQYFGFECAGARLRFTVNKNNVRHALGHVDCRMQLREITKNDDPVLDDIYALCSQKMMCCKRDRQRLLDIMHSWEGKLFALEDEKGLQGYLYAKDRDFLAEIGLVDESRMGELIKAYMLMTAAREVTVRVNPLNRVRAHYIKSFAEKWQLSDNQMLHVLSWQRTLEALMAVKADCQPLMDGRFVFEVEGAGRYAIEVKDHGVRVTETDDAPLMVMTAQKAVEFFFSPYTAMTVTSPMLKSWLPVPFGMYPADEF